MGNMVREAPLVEPAANMVRGVQEVVQVREQVNMVQGALAQEVIPVDNTVQGAQEADNMVREAQEVALADNMVQEVVLALVVVVNMVREVLAQVVVLVDNMVQEALAQEVVLVDHMVREVLAVVPAGNMDREALVANIVHHKTSSTPIRLLMGMIQKLKQV